PRAPGELSRSGRAAPRRACHCSAMIRTASRTARSTRAALVAFTLAACGSGTRPATGPDHPASAQPAPPASRPPAPPPADKEEVPLALWPEVKHGALPNGMQYYILKHKKPEHRAFLWLAVNAGAGVVGEAQRGRAPRGQPHW